MIAKSFSRLRTSLDAVRTYSHPFIIRNRLQFLSSSSVDDNSPKVFSYFFLGLTAFATRDHDLALVLGSDTRPINVEPYVDKALYPSGKWRLDFSSLEEARRFEDKLRKKFASYGYYITDVSTKKWSSSLLPAKDFNITNCTVRARNIPSSIKEHHLHYLFEDYNLADLPDKQPVRLIEQVYQKGGLGKDMIQYFVHFASPTEAMRAVMDKNFTLLGGQRITLFKYDF